MEVACSYARAYTVSSLTFLLSPFTSLEWRKWFSNRHETWPSAHSHQTEVRRSPQNRCHFSRGEEASKKFRGFSNFSLCRTKNSLSCFAGKGRRGSRILGRQSTSVGILEYSSRNTRVLLWQYSSTAPRVLEYCRESTAVLSLKYWDAAVSHVFLCGLFGVCYCTANFFFGASGSQVIMPDVPRIFHAMIRGWYRSECEGWR